MAAPFTQTLRALAADRRRGNVPALGAALLLVAAWLGWFLAAQLVVFEESQSARIETGRAAHPIDATLDGRIVALSLLLGQSVQAGEVLVELDAEIEKRRLIEAQTRLAMLAPEIEALRRELRARDQSLENDRQATATALEAGRARQHQAEIRAALLREEASRSAQLHASGVIAEMELLRVRADAQRQAAESEAAALDVIRQSRDQRTRESQGTSDLEELRRELAMLEGRQATTAASTGELVTEIERRTLRAASAGTVEDVAPLTVGSFVHEGDKLGTIVPAGELRVVAEFAPESAIGRVRPGQDARVRLDGYPWTQYGELRARVSRVASEVRQGQVRAELSVQPDPSSGISLQHGMTASVEVELERVTPAALVLRAVGKALRRAAPMPLPVAVAVEH